MLKTLIVQGFSFNMSVEKLGFPLPVKIEEDQKLFIDLDSEGNSPEDIVIEWHLEIRRLFGNYAASSGEIKLISVMKEYITAITERAINFEDIVRLHELVELHMEHIYWFYRDSDICFPDIYLDYMEHIMTFYVNVTLRTLLALKKKVKVTQKKVMDMSQRAIKRLSFYLLKSEQHIFHVLIRQTTTMVDGMIKDVMNVLNSNICKQMFRNLYMHFLVLTPVRDMSEEAFCRAFILFENWKAFEDYKQNEKIEECLKNIFNRDVGSIQDNEFLSKILTPKTSIMSELMRAMGCDPSITKAYFDYIKSKHKVEREVIDDIGKLSLGYELLAEIELLDDEDEDESEYIECFNRIMGNANYDLGEVVLDCKNENGDLATLRTEETEILVVDTDSDSDVEIVSIIPSQNSAQRSTAATRKSRNSASKTQPVISFLESISVDEDATRRKHGFRNSSSTNSNNKTPETSRTQTVTNHSTFDSPEEIIQNPPVQNRSIVDDKVCETVRDADEPVAEKLNNSFRTEMSEKESPKTDAGSTVASIPTVSVPIEVSTNAGDVRTTTENDRISENAARIPEPPPISNEKESVVEEVRRVDAAQVPEKAEVPRASKTPEGTNGLVNLACRCSNAVLSERNDSISEKQPAKATEIVKVIVERIPQLIKSIPKDVLTPELLVEENFTKEMMAASGKPESISSPIKTIPNLNNTVPIIEASAESDVSELTVSVASNQPVHNEDVLIDNAVQSTNCDQLGVQLNNLSIAAERSECIVVRNNGTSDVSACDSAVEVESDRLSTEISKECKDCDRTLNSEPVRSNNDSNDVSDRRTSDSEREENRGSTTISPLDTGQDGFVEPLDTGQFDPNSPASPEALNIPQKPANDDKIGDKKLSDPLLRKGQQHGEFGYPTPPGSEEEREKDSDEHADLIYSNILPTKPTQMNYEALTPNEIPSDDFICSEIEVGCVEVTTAESEVMERLSKEDEIDTSCSVGKSYEQIVKDAVGSQNSTEDEDDAPVPPKKNPRPDRDEDENISFDEMEQFLKNCDNEDYTPTNRKRKKRSREKPTDDGKPRKGGSSRSPKRVKINDTPETHFIPTSYDEDSKDMWDKQNDSDSSSSSSSDDEELSPNRLKVKRRPSPMPLSKYLNKRNGATAHIPLSGRTTPEKPPPLKGILKRIEQKHTYHPLHPVDDEPETVSIVLQHRNIGRGKRGSLEVKVYRKSFYAYKVPFDDHKLCQRAVVELEKVRTSDLDDWGKVSDRTREYDEDAYFNPEMTMYKIVFDKKTPQLNSNDRKYYCDTSISSDKHKSSLLESDKQGGKKRRSYARKSTNDHSEETAKPTKRGRKNKNSAVFDVPVTPKKRKEASPKYNHPVLTSLEEALVAYSNFYRKEEEEALLEENFSNKARNMHRIVKRFEQAIKNHRLGKHVDVEKLPIPPGYPPFPESGWAPHTDHSKINEKLGESDAEVILKFETTLKNMLRKRNAQDISRNDCTSLSPVEKYDQNHGRRKLENALKPFRTQRIPRYLTDYWYNLVEEENV